MADDKKNIPKKVPPAEASAPTVENVAMLEPPIPESALTDAGAVMLEHEGQQSSLSLSQAQKMRELEKYFGKDRSPIEMNKLCHNRLAVAGVGKENDHFPTIGEMVIFVLDFVPVENVQHFLGRHHIGFDRKILDIAGYKIGVGSFSCLHNHLIENCVVGGGNIVIDRRDIQEGTSLN